MKMVVTNCRSEWLRRGDVVRVEPSFMSEHFGRYVAVYKDGIEDPVLYTPERTVPDYFEATDA